LLVIAALTESFFKITERFKDGKYDGENNRDRMDIGDLQTALCTCIQEMKQKVMQSTPNSQVTGVFSDHVLRYLKGLTDQNHLSSGFHWDPVFQTIRDIVDICNKEYTPEDKVETESPDNHSEKTSMANEEISIYPQWTFPSLTLNGANGSPV